MSRHPRNRIELATALDVPEGYSHLIDGFTDALTNVIDRIVADFPGVSAYYVDPVHALSEIQVGFRFGNVRMVDVEDMADRILERALAEMAGDISGLNLSREDTSVAFA